MAEGDFHQFSDVTGSEPVFDFYCEICREEGKMIEAEGYCVDCEEYLCSTCFTHHRRTRFSRQHVLLDEEQMPKDTPLSYDKVNKDISKTCDNHAGKLVEYYCKSHDFLGCSMCFIEGHRNCNDIENIVKEADTIMESQEYKDFLQMLDQFNQRARDNIKLVKENLTKSKNCCKEVSKSLQRFREEINSVLDELEKKVVKQIETIQKIEEKVLIDISEKVTSSLESVETMIGELNHLQNSKKVCELYIKLKESKREAKQIQNTLGEYEKENFVKVFAFNPNTNLKETLNNQSELGTLLIQDSVTPPAKTVTYVHVAKTVATPAKAVTDPDKAVRALAGTDATSAKTVTDETKTVATHTKAVPAVPETTQDTALPQSNTIDTKATQLANIYAKSDKEQYSCIITGAAVMSYNRLIIVDQRNCKIKLIDTERNELINELKVESDPGDVTKINRNQAAVTLPNSNKLLLLSASDTLKLSSDFNVGRGCYGVTYVNRRNRLVVSFRKPPKLKVINLYGNVMKTLEHDSEGNKLFEWPRYVCLSNNDKTVYVSDCIGHKVTSLTFDGVEKAVYRDMELKYPTTVCVDHHDNVYVCGETSRNVHMLNADLTKIHIILTKADGLCNGVYSISHCQETNRLYIGMWNNRNMKVYQLSK